MVGIFKYFLYINFLSWPIGQNGQTLELGHVFLSIKK